MPAESAAGAAWWTPPAVPGASTVGVAMGGRDRLLLVTILGAPGAGKSTLARGLSETLGWPVVASGDVVRARLARGEMTGLWGCLHGRLPEPHRIVDLVLADVQMLLPARTVGTVIVEGFPRSVAQCRLVLERLGARRTLAAALLLEGVSPPDLVERVVRRRRRDADPAVELRRIRGQARHLGPMARYLAGRDVPVVRIDASHSPDCVLADGIAALGNLLGARGAAG